MGPARAPRQDPFQDRARSIGIVERQHRRFRKDVGCAKACWMPRIALDLDRTPIDGRDDDAAAYSRKRQCRCKLQRFAGNDPFGQLDVGYDLLIRLAAGSESRCNA